MKRGLLFGLALTFGFTGISIAAAPAKDGASLLEERCSVCHPAARPKAAQKTPAEWESTVSRMIGKGAQLTAGEKKVLVDYLGKTYKP
jgi:hypothetical protein